MFLLWYFCSIFVSNKKNESMEIIYTVERLAELLGLGEKTIRKLLNEGTIKGHKKNGRWFVLHSDVLKYITATEDAG